MTDPSGAAASPPASSAPAEPAVSVTAVGPAALTEPAATTDPTAPTESSDSTAGGDPAASGQPTEPDASVEPILGPVAGNERIARLDVIRGFALFGVLAINLLWMASPELLVPEEVLAALPTAGLDRWVGFALEWLLEGKAQALFSMLFGLGFAVQMERGAARGVDARATYARRLTILFLVGIAHLYLLWVGDILHAYALMGFVLLATRRWSDRALLVCGVLLSCLALSLDAAAKVALDGEIDGAAKATLDDDGAHDGASESSEGGSEASDDASESAEEAEYAAGVARRFDVYLSGDYGAFLAENVRTNYEDYLGTMFFPCFMAFILGRFLLGSWVARRRFLHDAEAHAARFRRVLPTTLAVGLLLGLPRAIDDYLGIDWPPVALLLASILGSASLLLVAAGYAMALSLLHERPAWRGSLDGLGAVGQMALTNYLAQSVFFAFVLYGFGFGLLRYAGATLCLALSLGFFALQIAVSCWWLARFQFGPAEWVWRGLTYGTFPAVRRAVGGAVAT